MPPTAETGLEAQEQGPSQGAEEAGEEERHEKLLDHCQKSAVIPSAINTTIDFVTRS
jgi:hypothetical protein